MNLPFILDVALGLIFVYLILSLLASEIQELIAALLQWRAKHLRESVTNLLAGGQQSPDSEKDQVKELVDKVYNDPLIRNINQVSAQGIAVLFRQATWGLAHYWNGFLQVVSRGESRKRSFGDGSQKSAPSYIPAETFATTLIESIGIADLSRLLIQQRLEKFKERLVKVTKGTLENIYDQETVKERVNKRANKFTSELQRSVDDYRNCEANLKTCISRMMESLDRLAAYFKDFPGDCSHEVFNELQALKENYFGEKGERAFQFGLQPSKSELIELIDQGSKTYREIKPLFDAILASDSQGANLAKLIDVEIVKLKLADADKNSNDTLTEDDRKKIRSAAFTEGDREKFTSEAIKSIKLTDEETRAYEIYRNFQQIDQVINGLPKYVKDSLRILARRTRFQIQQIEFHTYEVANEVAHLRHEIEVWFDRSMDRASGVYKRNSKGVAIILGFVLAVATNSDTFHIFSQFSNDEKLRQVIVQNAATITQKNTSSKFDGAAIKNDTDKALKEIALPVGWNSTVVKQQLNCDKPGTDWTSIFSCNSVENPFKHRTKQETSFFIPEKIIGMMAASSWDGATMLMGWFISGIAISMGAPFWFDLLGKVMNVRNTGKPPKSSTTNQTTSSSYPKAPGS